MIYVKIGEKQFPASVTGKLSDKDWDNRASKSITAELSYEEAARLFVDDAEWYIMQETVADYQEVLDAEGNPKLDENGEPVLREVTSYESFDNSEYSVAGDIVAHRDGTVTIKMGKPTAEELLNMIVEGLAL